MDKPILEHIESFIGYYHTGDYVYDQVLHREFYDIYDDEEDSDDLEDDYDE